MAERPELQTQDVLPCGCIMGTALVDGVKEFVMEPCSTQCEYYQFALGEAAAQGKPIDFREVP